MKTTPENDRHKLLELTLRDTLDRVADFALMLGLQATATEYEILPPHASKAALQPSPSETQADNILCLQQAKQRLKRSA